MKVREPFRPRPPAVSWALAALLALCSTLHAQDVAPSATLSADSVSVAEVFELLVRLRVPSGSVVYFPDTIAATLDVESFAPVEWRAERAPGGGATLTLTYPLIPFGPGLIDVPGLDVLTGPAGSDPEGEAVPGGSVVGAWADAGTGSARVLSATRIADQQVWVDPAFTGEDAVRGLSPRPPDDVMGFSWSWPAVALILLFSSVVGGAVVTTTRDWLASRPEPRSEPRVRPLTLEEARLHALAELDRLLAARPHAKERAQELYTASSDIVRGYVERLDPAWGSDLTASELMGRLTASTRDSRDLADEMRVAEAVKFGRVRPGAPASEEHLQALRGWLADGGGVRP